MPARALLALLVLLLGACDGGASTPPVLAFGLAQAPTSLDPRYATEIFKPFRRLHGRSDSFRGHGLGLAICRRIVRRNGGQIWAESLAGEGATFHVMLPAWIEDDAPIEIPPEAPARTGTSTLS